MGSRFTALLGLRPCCSCLSVDRNPSLSLRFFSLRPSAFSKYNSQLHALHSCQGSHFICILISKSPLLKLLKLLLVAPELCLQVPSLYSHSSLNQHTAAHHNPLTPTIKKIQNSSREWRPCHDLRMAIRAQFPLMCSCTHSTIVSGWTITFSGSTCSFRSFVHSTTRHQLPCEEIFLVRHLLHAIFSYPSKMLVLPHVMCCGGHMRTGLDNRGEKGKRTMQPRDYSFLMLYKFQIMIYYITFDISVSANGAYLDT